MSIAALATNKVTEILQCRSCEGKLFTEVLDLGNQYVVDFPIEPGTELLQAPLELVRCNSCHLVQLKHSVDPNSMFRHFWYRSGISESMKAALHDVVVNAARLTNLSPGDIVLDIGSNDGTTLHMFRRYGAYTLGVEPCKSLADESVKEGRVDEVFTEFFSKEVLKKWLGRITAITAIAMFYDVANPKQFLADCKDLLAENGVLVIQMNYLKTMLTKTALDNISHEHLTYWHLNVFRTVAESVGLEVRGASLNDVNGGSIRIYLTRKGAVLSISQQDEAVMRADMSRLLSIEHQVGLSSGDGTYYELFAYRVQRILHQVRDYILKTRNAGAKWYVYGASTRGTVLLQALGLQKGVLLGVAERDQNKYGRKMVAGWLPIHDEGYCRARASHFLVLPYHFRSQIIKREKTWVNHGGELFFPLPEPVSFTLHGERHI